MPPFPKEASERHRSAAVVLLSAALYGISPILMKVALGYGMSPVLLLALRSLIAIPLLSIALVLSRALALPPRRHALSLLLMGATLMPLQIYGFILGLKYLPVSSVAVLAALYPLHVAWIAWLFLGERIRWPDVPVLALVIAGAVLVTGQTPALGRTPGLAALAVTTLASAIYAVAARRVLQDVEPLAALTVLLPASGAIFIAVSVFAGEWGTPIQAPALWATVGSGLLAGVSAPLLLLHGFRRLPAAHVAVLSSFEPVITVLLGVVVLGDRLSPVQALGAVSIIGGIATLQVFHTARAEALPVAARTSTDT